MPEKLARSSGNDDLARITTASSSDCLRAVSRSPSTDNDAPRQSSRIRKSRGRERGSSKRSDRGKKVLQEIENNGCASDSDDTVCTTTPTDRYCLC